MGLAQKCAEYINSVKKSSVMQTYRMTFVMVQEYGQTLARVRVSRT